MDCMEQDSWQNIRAQSLFSRTVSDMATGLVIQFLNFAPCPVPGLFNFTMFIEYACVVGKLKENEACIIAARCYDVPASVCLVETEEEEREEEETPAEGNKEDMNVILLPIFMVSGLFVILASLAVIRRGCKK